MVVDDAEQIKSCFCRLFAPRILITRELCFSLIRQKVFSLAALLLLRVIINELDQKKSRVDRSSTHTNYCLLGVCTAAAIAAGCFLLFLHDHVGVRAPQCFFAPKLVGFLVDINRNRYIHSRVFEPTEAENYRVYHVRLTESFSVFTALTPPMLSDLVSNSYIFDAVLIYSQSIHDFIRNDMKQVEQ